MSVAPRSQLKTGIGGFIRWWSRLCARAEVPAMYCTLPIPMRPTEQFNMIASALSCQHVDFACVFWFPWQYPLSVCMRIYHMYILVATVSSIFLQRSLIQFRVPFIYFHCSLFIYSSIARYRGWPVCRRSSVCLLWGAACECVDNARAPTILDC